MFCKILFYLNENDWDGIISELKKNPQNCTIITTNKKLNEFLKNQKIISDWMEEIFPQANVQTYEINMNGRRVLDDYRKLFDNLTFHGIEIFSSIENQLLKEIILLEKAKKILDKKKNIIFIFDEFSNSYFAILRLALEQFYDKIDSKIYQSLGKTTKIIDEEMKIPQLNFRKKYDYFKTIPINEAQKNEERFQTKNLHEAKESDLKSETSEEIDSFQSSLMKITQLFQIFSISLKIFCIKFFQLFKIDSTSYLIKKVEKKIHNLSKKNEAKCAFFVTSKRNDLVIPISNIVNKFQKKEVPIQIFSFDMMTNSILSKQKISFIDLFEESYLISESIKKNEEIKILCEKIKKITKTKLLFDIKQFFNFIIDEMVRSIAIMVVCEKIFNYTNFNSIVITFNATRNGNAVIATSKKHKIQNFSIVTLNLSVDPLLSDLYKTDKLCVYGQHGMDALEKLGYNKKNIFLTGNPRYDHLNTIIKNKQKQFLEDTCQINKEKKLIVIAMSRWHNNDEGWMSEIIKFCNKHNFEIVIKIHPNYKRIMNDFSSSKIKTIKENCKNQKFTITYDIDTTTLLSSSDILITDFSNVCIEANLLSKPVLTVNFSKEDFSNVERFHEYDASIYLENYVDLEKMILEIIVKNKYLEKFKKGKDNIVKKFNTYNDGMASKRIIDLLLNQEN